MPTELLPTGLTLLYTLLAQPTVHSLPRRLWGATEAPFAAPRPPMFHPSWEGSVEQAGQGNLFRSS